MGVKYTDTRSRLQSGQRREIKKSVLARSYKSWGGEIHRGSRRIWIPADHREGRGKETMGTTLLTEQVIIRQCLTKEIYVHTCNYLVLTWDSRAGLTGKKFICRLVPCLWPSLSPEECKDTCTFFLKNLWFPILIESLLRLCVLPTRNFIDHT